MAACIRAPRGQAASMETIHHTKNPSTAAHHKSIIQIYTDWGNHYLEKARSKKLLADLQTDLVDGVLLADLIESVTNQKVPDVQRKPKTAAQMAAVVLVVCGLSAGFAAPAARVGLMGIGRQGISAGIGIGSMATNMATGLASNTLGALGGIPLLGPFAQIGKAAVETGNNFAQMGMGIGQMAVNGFGGLGGAAQQQLTAQQIGRQQLAAQLAAEQQQRQQLAAQLGTQQQLTAQLGAQQQQLAAQLAAQQQMSLAAAQQQGGNVQRPGANFRQTDSFQDILGSPDLDSWWNPSPPQPIYIG